VRLPVSLSSRDDYDYQILTEFEARQRVSQRSLASRLGIALGLTNLLVRRLVKKGLVRVVGIRPHRVRYLLTPAGFAEKARMSQVAFQHSVQRFQLARARISDAFLRASAEWPLPADEKPIFLLGTGELAEIGYISLQESDLTLVGVIDDRGRSRFFGVPVYPPERLSPALLDSAAGSRLVVMSLRPRAELESELGAAGIPPERIIWI